MKIFILGFLIIAQAIVGSFILFRKSQKISPEAFSHALHLISAALFALGIVLFSFQTHDQSNLLFWGRFLYAFSFLGGTTFMSFSFFLTKNKYAPPIGYINIFVSIAFFILTLTSGIVVKDAIELGQKLVYTDNLWLLLAIQPGPYLIGAIALIKHFFTTSNKIEKRQIQIISIGMVPSIGIAVFVNFLFPVFFSFFDWFWLGVFSLVGCSTTTTYVIQRYRFFDIKSTISITVKKVLAYLLSFGILLFPLTYYTDFLQNPNNIYTIAGFFLLFSMVYTWAIRFFNSEFFHRHFGLSNFEYFEQIIKKFRNQNFSFNSVEEFQNQLKKIFETKLHIKKCTLMVNSPALEKKYKKLITQLLKDDKILVTKEWEFLSKNKSGNYPFLKELKKLGEVCIPLENTTKNLIGILILGKKEFDDMYSGEEIKMFETIKSKISLTLTGLLYSDELEKEVAAKTKVLKKQQAQLQKSNKELKKLDELKDSFLSIASHELRTPMTVIKGYSEFLLSEKFGGLNEKQKQFQEKIFNNTQQLLKLINDILDLSKLDAERMMFNFAEIDIPKMMEDVLSNFKLLCEKKNITLDLKIDKKVKTMFCDSEKIGRILNNLIGNAYKFTPENGTITIKVSLYQKNKNLILFEVIDTGIGIAPENYDKVFEKFEQVANYLQTPYNGTGLGLPIVKKIIEKLNGSIWIESETNKGSNFLFTLPITQTAHE